MINPKTHNEFDHGEWTVKIVATLVKADIKNGLNTVDRQSKSNSFKIIIDDCNPVPCNFNEILSPDSATISDLGTTAKTYFPTDFTVFTNGTEYFTQTSFYQDKVSRRCSITRKPPGAVYQNLCDGDVKLKILQMQDGASTISDLDDEPVLPIEITKNSADKSYKLSTRHVDIGDGVNDLALKWPAF